MHLMPEPLQHAPALLQHTRHALRSDGRVAVYVESRVGGEEGEQGGRGEGGEGVDGEEEGGEEEEAWGGGGREEGEGTGVDVGFGHVVVGWVWDWGCGGVVCVRSEDFGFLVLG